MDKLAALAILLTVTAVIYFLSPKSEELNSSSQLVNNSSQAEARTD